MYHTRLTHSVAVLFLLGSISLVARGDKSVDGDTGQRQQTPQAGVELSDEDFAKMRQGISELLKQMQQSGLVPADVEIPENSTTQSGGAEAASRSASSSSSSSRKSLPAHKTGESSAGTSWIKPLLEPDVEYAATSYIEQTISGTLVGGSKLIIYESPEMARFQLPEEFPGERNYIYRYDKGLVWGIIIEDREYSPGIRLYEEFELTDGIGMTWHISEIMRAYDALKQPEKLQNLGQETIDGIVTTRYQKRAAARLPNQFDTSDYWLSDSGILIKVTADVPDSDMVYVLETKDIRLGKQPENLFVPPPDYVKAGPR